MKKFLIILFVLLTLVFGMYYFVTHEREISLEEAKSYFSAYDAYNEMEEAFERAVYLPGTGNNSVRHSMDSRLIQVLDESTPSQKRLLLASEGAEYSNNLFDQIKAIEIGRGRLIEKTDTLQEIAEEISGSVPRETALSIISLAVSRVHVAERIATILEERRIETKRVFETVVADRGALTSSHLNLLNKRVGPAEVRFDELSRLYTYFESLDEKEDRMFSEFSKKYRKNTY